MTSPPQQAIRILLVEDAADSLATIGAELLEQGFEVSMVTDPRAALEISAEPRFDAFLVAEETLRSLGPKLDAVLRERPEPHFVLVGDAETAWAKNEVSRADVHVIAQRVIDAVHGGGLASRAPEPPRRSGTLGPDWLQPLVQTFAAERVTGTLSVTTTDGAGELRFARGEIVDAVYSKLDGLKAFFRVAEETEGTWGFTEASSLVMRRITMATADLLRLAPEELARIGQLRSALGNLEGWGLLADQVDGQVLGPLATAMVKRLAAPRTLEALLDESPETDAELLAALVELDAAVLLRRVRTSARSIIFTSPQLVDRAVAHAARSLASGFRGPVRVVFACTTSSLSLLAHATARLDEAVSTNAVPPEAPAPYELVKLRVAEDAAIALVALPLDPMGSPLWPLMLAGTLAVITLAGQGDPLLASVCSSSGVPLLVGRSIVPGLDPGDPEHIAELVRAVL
jgi:CheY-like chemotaxis protein